MVTMTDPARELAEMCEALSAQSNKRGDEHLASFFSVRPWSPEFYQILFCIVERISSLMALVDLLEMDSDLKKRAISHLEILSGAFHLNAISNIWNPQGPGFQLLRREDTAAVMMLSPQIRTKISYPKLSDAELKDILALVDELSGWLGEQQLIEQDFIRQSIIEGLSNFRFRLERIKWLGWGYTLESLREVVGAYLALERGLQNSSVEQPNAEAILKKVGKFLEEFYEKTEIAKGLIGTGDMVLRIYGALSMISSGVSISGFLPPP